MNLFWRVTRFSRSYLIKNFGHLRYQESKLTLTFPFDIHLKWCSTTDHWRNLLLRSPSIHLWRHGIQALACSPLLPCNQVLPCALAAFLWKRLHSHGLACNQVLPTRLSQLSITSCSCGVPPVTFAPSWALVAIASCSRDISRVTLALSRGPIDSQAAIVIGLPLLSGYHHSWVTIVVGLPSLSGYHCCWSAIVVGLSSLPHSLRLPQNGLLIVGLHCCPILLCCLRMPHSLSSLGCHHCPVPSCTNSLSAYPADPCCLFVLLVRHLLL